MSSSLAEVAGALTGMYVALLVRGPALAQAVEQVARTQWPPGASPSIALHDVAHVLALQSAVLLAGAALGGLAAGSVAHWLGGGRSRVVAMGVAVAGVGVGAMLIRRVVADIAALAAAHAPVATILSRDVAELRWLGGWCVALAWAGAILETLLIRGRSEVQDESSDGAHAEQAAERRRRRAEVLQPGE